MATKTTATFKSLLKQKDFTADELGRVIFYYNVFSNQKDFRKKVPFSVAELTDKMKKLGENNKFNRDIFALYINLADTFQNLMKKVAFQSSLLLHSRSSVDKFIIILTSQLFGKKQYRQRPLIVTEKDYNEALEASMKRNASKDAPNPELGCRLESLYRLAIEYYLKKLKEEPEAPNPLKDLEEKYKAEPITDERLIDFCREHGSNHEIVTYKFRGKPVTEFFLKGWLLNHCSNLENPNDIDRNIKLSFYSDMLNSDKPYLGVRLQLEDLFGGKVEVVLHSQPSKWDLLKAKPFRPEAFRCFGDYEGEDWVKEYKKDLNIFVSTYTDIVKYINKECELSKKDLEELENVNSGFYGNFYWELDKYDFRKDYVTGATALFPNEKTASNGLAIVKEGIVDEEGKVKPFGFVYPRVNKIFSPGGSDYAELKEAVKVLTDASYLLSAWEFIVSQVKDIVKVDKLEVFSFTDIFKKQYEGIHSFIDASILIEEKINIGLKDNIMPDEKDDEDDKEDRELVELYKDIFSYPVKHRYKIDENDKDYIRSRLFDLRSTTDNLEECVKHFSSNALGGTSGR